MAAGRIMAVPINAEVKLMFIADVYYCIALFPTK
jgi:hypothetical protein